MLKADGFEDLIERFEYLRRISRRNASVLGDLRGARKEVAGQAVALKKMRTTFVALARDAAADRDRADAIRTALLNRERTQLQRRGGRRDAARLRAGPDRGDRAPPARGRPRGRGRELGDHRRRRRIPAGGGGGGAATSSGA